MGKSVLERELRVQTVEIRHNLMFGLEWVGGSLVGWVWGWVGLVCKYVMLEECMEHLTCVRMFELMNHHHFYSEVIQRLLCRWDPS